MILTQMRIALLQRRRRLSTAATPSPHCPYSRNELKSMALLLCFMAGMPGDEQQGVSSTLVAANNFFR